jgi:dTDP-4-amino-4,6-dideoxygalactose transaminase
MKKRKIEFYRHNLSTKDTNECLKVLNSIFLTTGEYVKKFEHQFARYLGIKYVIGVSSCTDALFLALKYLNIKPGDEVITTAFSFIATSNAIEYCGAKPVFVDAEPDTGNIDADKIEKAITSKTKAILIAHMYGLMCDMKKIRKIANAHKLKIIEDSAHCIEGTRDGIKPGQLSDFACFSFYATKTITSGEGGALATNNTDAYEWFMKARLHGMSKSAADRYVKRYQHNEMEFLGYKCNMTNIAASLLIHQLERIEQLRKKRERIAELYNRGFAKNNKIARPSVLTNSIHARYLYTIWVDPKKRDEYVDTIQDKGIGVAVHFIPIHLEPYYQKKYGYKKGDFPVAERLGNSTISLPFYPKLTNKQIKTVISTVNAITGA